MRIRQITIRNYRGIAEREVAVGESGAIVKGRNGAGKSSILDAVRAALGAQNAGPDAIRLGADKAEILLDLDDAVVRRTIAHDGTKLDVRNGEGDKKSKPAAFLASLLGAGQLDPLEIMTERDRGKRKAAILSAIPMTIDEATLREILPSLPAGTIDCSGHALDVVARLRDRYYAARTSANAAAKDAESQADAAKRAVDALGEPATLDPDADGELQAAERALAQIEARATEAERARERSASARERAAAMREQARAVRAGAEAPDAETAAEAERRAAECDAEVERLRALLTAALDAAAVADAECERHRQIAHAFDAACKRATALDEQAAQIEQAIAESTVEPPTEDEAAAARVRIDAARERVATHRRAVEQAAAASRHVSAATFADKLRAEADALDKLVSALRSDVPAALIARSDAIPGLAIDGDAITLDGVSLDQLNDAAKLRFAVQLAKRASPRAKVLVSDRLELLDPEQFDAFVAEAIADGWQLLGARVDRGDVRIEAIGE